MIRFVSSAAGPRALIGSRPSVTIFDEFPNRDVFNEARVGGSTVMLGTPLNGDDWIYREIVMSSHAPNRRAHMLATCDNPHVDGASIARRFMSIEPDRAALMGLDGQ